MEQLSRVQLYQRLIDKDISEKLSDVLRININILSGVEENFLTSDQRNESKEIDYFYLIDRIRNNAEMLGVDNQNISYSSVIKLKENIKKIVFDYEEKEGAFKRNARNLFNRLINELGRFNSKIIDSVEYLGDMRQKSDMKQVFLSHAYDDKVYSLALFLYFYEQGIYLYVGWMHNEDMLDGRELKIELQRQLDKSSQLLFLRTLNSELDIQGKQMLRPWCAWELGNFYCGKHGGEKYLLNLYSVDCYKNIQLHGLKLYTGVVGNMLQGIEIRI